MHYFFTEVHWMMLDSDEKVKKILLWALKVLNYL